MELEIINKNNEVLDLLKNKDKFLLSKAENLHGLDVTISTNASPYLDGAEVSQVKALPRGIELTLKLIGDVKQSIDFITSIVKSKQQISLRQKEGDKETIIKGFVNITPYSRMVANCAVNISIYCGQPYWEDINYIVGAIAQKIDLLCFPLIGQFFPVEGRPFGEIDTNTEKDFYNHSDVTVGFKIEMTAFGEVVNPRIGCSTGEQNGYYMQLNITLATNDLVEISTIKGEKSIKINGADTYNDTPVLDYLEFFGEDWLQLETGKNTFELTAESGQTNIYFNIVYKGRYE